MLVKLFWVLGLVASLVTMTVFRVRRVNAARSRVITAQADVR